MMDSPQLQLEESAGLLRITIPFGTREKMWMAVALTVMLVFAGIMSLIAEYAARSATHVAVILLFPFFMFGIIAALYLLTLLAIRSMPGSVIEFDGRSLSVGSIGSPKRTRWAKGKIKALTVSRLPMVPVANLVIHIESDPSVRTAVCRHRDLELAAAKLRSAIGLKDRT